MVTAAAAFVVILGLGFAVVWLGLAVRCGVRRQPLLMALWLTAIALVVSAGSAAAPVAERMNHWSNDDHDGMLDGFANGSYDWTDVNGGDWLRTWAALDLVVFALVGAGVAVAASRAATDEG